MTGSLHEVDRARLDRLIRLVVTRTPAEIAACVVPDLAYFLTARCSFGHAALLVFPTGHPDLLAALAERGFRCSPPVPSTVVRDRLRQRCGLVEAPSVQIVHARTTIAAGATRELEVFLAPSGLAEAAARERAEETESHLAFVPDDPDDAGVRELCGALLSDGLARDGGGFNPHENVTTLYFRRPRPTGFVYRLELACPGRFPAVLAEHLHGHAAASAPRPHTVGAR